MRHPYLQADAPPARTRKEPLSESAYRVIRSRILERVVHPGETLVEITLAKELGVSRSPIRYALRRLEQEGLVVYIPNKGTCVASLSPFDVAEAYNVREVIEGLAARLLARRITRGQAEILQDLAAKADDPAATISDDSAFHFAIIRLSGRTKLAEIVGTHCQHSLTHDEHGRWPGSDDGAPCLPNRRISDLHQRIVEKIISGNPAEAEEAVRQHVRMGKSAVARSLLGLDEVA